MTQPASTSTLERIDPGTPPDGPADKSICKESVETDAAFDAADEDSAEKSTEASAEMTEEQRKASRRKILRKRASGGINDHHLYRQFRLQMVELFGSLAAAFYEIEMKARAGDESAEPTGKISLDGFKLVVHDELQIFSGAETDTLFRFVTDNTYLTEGVSGIASYKDFGVAENEWKYVVKRKIAERNGEKKSVFTSTTSGQSTGLYHRPMHVDTIAQKAEKAAKKIERDGSKQRRQQRGWGGWQPSMLAGGGPGARLEELAPKSTKSTKGKSPPWNTTSTGFKTSLVGGDSTSGSGWADVTRPRDVKEEAYLQCQCPTRRSEMALRTAAVLVVEPWWPYEGEARNSPGRRVRRSSPRSTRISGSSSAR